MGPPEDLMAERDDRSPHCDPRILHEPGACRVCDLYPRRQGRRIAGGVNFTGCAVPGKTPCPADQARSTAQSHAWPGNRAQNR